MNRESAVEMLTRTFEAAFDEGQFGNLARNLLNRIDESREFTARGAYIKDAFKEHVHEYKRLGTYTDPEGAKVDVLVVQLKKASALDHARTMQRNFVAAHLKDRNEKDAAIVAYYAKDCPDWRFSLVKMEYQAYYDPEAERMRVEETLTPARRYSFLVGGNEPNHTAQQRLLPILEDSRNNPTLAQLEAAFNIETVTKEFFERYKELFLDLKEELDTLAANSKAVQAEFQRAGINSANFAKKLLGQIVFLYFLQKKGWLGVETGQPWGTGPKNFLHRLFQAETITYNNFFNEVLEPLFYAALAVARPNDYFPKLNCRVPFLNGGLFEPVGNYDWRGVDVLLDNAHFRAIFDTFDRFNFTVREDEPLEKEVAVDPEMLGKVFENLLDVQDRKSKGAFYTPREIVHYMCQESLINYLDATLNPAAPAVMAQDNQPSLFATGPESGAMDGDLSTLIPRADLELLIREGEMSLEHDAATAAKPAETKTYSYRLPETIRTHAAAIDAALADIKICDPAIGSGAFPVGLMHEIVKTRTVLTTYLPGKGAEGAEGAESEEEPRTPYAFKRHAIQHSIYGVDIDPGAVDIAKLRLWLSLVVDEERYDRIQPLPNLDYKIVCGNALLGIERTLFNTDLFSELENLKSHYFESTNVSEKHSLKARIDELITQLTYGNAQFDFAIYFSEVFHEKGGFDIVIGNPPYGARINKNELRKIKKKLVDTKNSNSAALFIDYSKNRLLKAGGTLAFIVPKSLLYSENWFDLVKAMLDYVSILVDVEKAFEKVKLEQVVFVYNNAIKSNDYSAIKFLDNSFIKSTFISKRLVLKHQAWLCDVSEKELSIIQNLNANYVYMNTISQTKRGVGFQKHLAPEGIYPVIGGINISRYGCDGIKGYLDESFLNSSRSKKITFIQQPKIISQDLIAHIKNPSPHIMIMSYFDEAGTIIGLDTVQNTVIHNKNYDYKYILALLNSTFTSWYTYKFIYCSAIRTMHFDNYYIGKIPVPRITLEDQSPFIELSTRILDAKAADPDTDVSALEAEIDRLVYKLYDLTPEEIEIIEGK